MRAWSLMALAIASVVACGDNVRSSPNSPDASPADARLIDAAARCGDGQLDPGEECDEPTAGLSGDGCSSTCRIEIFAGTNLTPNPMKPRLGHAMAYDSMRQRAVVFGGRTTAVNDETWEWDGSTWTRIQTLVSPPARERHAMVYDSARQRVFLFGGVDANGDALGDSWVWDGVTWVQMLPATPPSPRTSLMAFDPARQLTVMVSMGETWEWNGIEWSMRGPAVQAGFALAFGGNGVVLVGVSANHTWDGASWSTQSFNLSLEPWYEEGWAVYDSVRDQLMLVSQRGVDRDGLFVWEWNGATWVRRSPVLTGGPFRLFPGAVAFDAARNVVVLSGAGIEHDQTWRWNGAGWLQAYDSAPKPRATPFIAYDSRRGRTVMFGGIDNADTWEWTGSSWLAMNPSSAPSSRYGRAMAYDERRGRMVLFGGSVVDFDQFGSFRYTPSAETWEWDGQDWYQRFSSSSPPPCGLGCSSSYDRAHGYVLLVSSGETWKWDGTSWTNLMPTQSPGLVFNTLAYDARRGVTVLVNGDTWEWDGSNWSSKGDSPPTDALYATFYDPLRARIVSGPSYGDNQFSSWDGSTWSALGAINGLRLSGGMVFDRASGAWFSFGAKSGWDTWLVRLDHGDPDEQCDGTDADSDELIGCADPDCWWRCSPLCGPGETACDPNAPRCGDASCSSIETSVLCPADCP